ncbi:MAG: hypothetical protein DRP01_03215, partial [Archaeoglobales archaeon]
YTVYIHIILYKGDTNTTIAIVSLVVIGMSVKEDKIVDRVIEKLVDEIKNSINLSTLRILTLDSLRSILARRIAEELSSKIFTNIKIEMTDTIVVRVKGSSIEINLEDMENEIIESVKKKIIEKVVEGVKMSFED